MRRRPTEQLGIMKCPKCGFEQIEESPDECAKCGILFEKWLERRDNLLPELAPIEVAPHPVEPLKSHPQFWVEPPARVIGGSRLCQVGLLMMTLPIVSFLINLVGFEFILLMPFEAFDDPTRAKFWMMGIGLGVLVIGGAMGGELPEEE